MIDFATCNPLSIKFADLRTEESFADFAKHCNRFGYTRALFSHEVTDAVIRSDEHWIVFCDDFYTWYEEDCQHVRIGNGVLQIPDGSKGTLLLVHPEGNPKKPCYVYQMSFNVEYVEDDDCIVDPSYSDFLKSYPKKNEVSLPLTLQQRQELVGKGILPDWNDSFYTETLKYRLEDVDYPNALPPYAVEVHYRDANCNTIDEVTSLCYKLGVDNRLAYMELFYIPKSKQGQGIGFALFSRQVEILSTLPELDSITNYANDGDDIGYWVWPKFGFDGIVYQSQKTLRYSEYDHKYENNKAIHVSEILSKKGMQYWMKNGVAFKAKFSLKADSYSMKKLQTLRKSKGRTI